MASKPIGAEEATQVIASYQAILTMHGQTWSRLLETLERVVTLWETNGTFQGLSEDSVWAMKVRGVREWCQAQRILPPTVRCTQVTPIPAALLLPDRRQVAAALLFPLNGDRLWQWVFVEPLPHWSDETLQRITQTAERVWQRVCGDLPHNWLLTPEVAWCYCDWLSALSEPEQAALRDAVYQRLEWLRQQGWIVGVSNGEKKP